MRKAMFFCILLALGSAIGMAQDRTDSDDDYRAHFGGWDDESSGAAQGPVEEGPRSIAEAREQGRGYRIGAHGVHAAAPNQDTHVVEQGDTLWGISDYYYGSPWHWPELWSFNPEVTNPHWIYPLDQLRLSPAKLEQDQAVAKAAATGGFAEHAATPGQLSGTEGAVSVVVPRELMTPGTVFLRDSGYLDKEALRSVGQIIGGNEEQMFLSPSDQVYIKFRGDEDVRAGQAYTIFRRIYEREREEAEQGELVRILGTAVVRSYERDKRVARAVVTEALEPIERGIFVAKLDRRFDLVNPKRNEANVVAKIIASVQPRRLLSYGNVVFLDVGEGHGIQPGNRFFVVRKGDEWLASLEAEATELGNIAEVPPYNPDELPKEVVAELRVLKVRKQTTIALITRSDTDLKIGDTAEMRVGF
jgi:hypothetical protein